MYIKNKLGIYVYPEKYYINNIRFNVNSISHNTFGKFRMINYKLYGIYITHNVHKK